MAYDSRATEVLRLDDIRTQLAKARKAISVGTATGESFQRSYELLLQEEKDVLERINQLDSSGGTIGGMSNLARFDDPI